MARIFLSYRRDDSSGYAGRLYDRLSQHFGRDNLFMDIDTVALGLDFVEVIQDAVGSCDVLLAVIGRQWLTSTDPLGHRRLDNPEDFVRLEIATALERRIRVIPVLVGGASMPHSTELPDALQPLARRQALVVGDYFHPDVDRLIATLETASSPILQAPPRTGGVPVTGEALFRLEKSSTKQALPRGTGSFPPLQGHYQTVGCSRKCHTLAGRFLPKFSKSR